MSTKYFKAGVNVSLTIDFIDGDYFVPDPGSVTYSLYDASGNIVSPLINVPVSTTGTTTRVVITIPAAYNTLTTGVVTFKKLIVSYTKDSAPGSITKVYKLYPHFNTWVTPNEVRKLLGVNDRELPDDDIDIVEAYFQVRALLGETVFDAAVASSDMSAYYVNAAIRAKAALNTIPGIKFRLTYKESDGALTYQRLQNVDLDALIDELQAEFDKNMNLLDPSPITADTATRFFELSVRTDPFTGA